MPIRRTKQVNYYTANPAYNNSTGSMPIYNPVDGTYLLIDLDASKDGKYYSRGTIKQDITTGNWYYVNDIKDGKVTKDKAIAGLLGTHGVSDFFLRQTTDPTYYIDKGFNRFLSKLAHNQGVKVDVSDATDNGIADIAARFGDAYDFNTNTVDFGKARRRQRRWLRRHWKDIANPKSVTTTYQSALVVPSTAPGSAFLVVGNNTVTVYEPKPVEEETPSAQLTVETPVETPVTPKTYNRDDESEYWANIDDAINWDNLKTVDDIRLAYRKAYKLKYGLDWNVFDMADNSVWRQDAHYLRNWKKFYADNSQRFKDRGYEEPTSNVKSNNPTAASTPANQNNQATSKHYSAIQKKEGTLTEKKGWRYRGGIFYPNGRVSFTDNNNNDIRGYYVVTPEGKIIIKGDNGNYYIYHSGLFGSGFGGGYYPSNNLESQYNTYK